MRHSGVPLLIPISSPPKKKIIIIVWLFPTTFLEVWAGGFFCFQIKVKAKQNYSLFMGDYSLSFYFPVPLLQHRIDKKFEIS